MRAGAAAVCDGSVVHHRTRPTEHEFRNPVSYVWLDPDDPDALCDAHPLWSASRPSPARFRRRDYGIDTAGPLGESVRNELADVLGARPEGDVRMLTQVRRWGWLFNPITVYMVWHVDPDTPVGAVLEVTNTPWKERHRYPVLLQRPDSAGWLAGQVDKRLHVSPFLDERFGYDLRLRGDDDRIELRLDVVRPDASDPTVTTTMRVTRRAATRDSLGRALRINPIPTHRVSLGIHAQALRLLLKRVPFVPHPSKRAAET